MPPLSRSCQTRIYWQEQPLTEFWWNLLLLSFIFKANAKKTAVAQTRSRVTSKKACDLPSDHIDVSVCKTALFSVAIVFPVFTPPTPQDNGFSAIPALMSTITLSLLSATNTGVFMKAGLNIQIKTCSWFYLHTWQLYHDKQVHLYPLITDAMWQKNICFFFNGLSWMR